MRAVCAVLYYLFVLHALPANGEVNLQQSIYLEDPDRMLGAEQALSHLRAGEGIPAVIGLYRFVEPLDRSETAPCAAIV